jgi:FecR protein
MNQKRNILFGLFVLLLIGGAVVFFTRIADYPAAQAVLLVRSGTAIVARTGGQPESIEAGTQTQLSTRDAIKVNGQASIMFAGAQTELSPGSELEIAHYGALGSESQIELLLKSGQAWQRAAVYQDGRSLYRLRTPVGMISTRSGEFLVIIGDDQESQLGVLAGEATVGAQGRTVTLREGEGTVIAPGRPPTDPTPWSRVRVATYRPDGSAVTMPVTLWNTKTGSRYEFPSQMPYIVPEGSYNLSVEALEAYQVNDLALVPGNWNDLPVTLGELVFATTDAVGNPVAFSALNVQGTSALRAVPDAAVLISPGKWTVFAAREEKPNAIQQAKVDVLPGQRVVVPLRNDLFGGGTVQPQVTAIDGSPFPPVVVHVYAAGYENGQPLLAFKSDRTQPLPEGNYVISVRTPVAQRFEVTIKQNQEIPLQVQLGAIAVEYTDTAGHTDPRNVLVYIASSPDMQRLGLPIDQMRQTPYGIAVNCCQPVWVPAGVYNVVVDDSADTGQKNVRVEAGQTVPVVLKAGS